jgi:hypothetical protein
MVLGVDDESPSTTAEKPSTLYKAYIIITERKKGTVLSTSFTRLKTHIIMMTCTSISHPAASRNGTIF